MYRHYTYQPFVQLLFSESLLDDCVNHLAKYLSSQPNITSHDLIIARLHCLYPLIILSSNFSVLEGRDRLLNDLQESDVGRDCSINAAIIPVIDNGAFSQSRGKKCLQQKGKLQLR